MEKTDLLLMDNMAWAIILFYVLSGICWFRIFGMIAKFKHAFTASYLVMGGLWFFYAYKVYSYFFINNQVSTYTRMWLNLSGVIILFACSFMIMKSSKMILNILDK